MLKIGFLLHFYQPSTQFANVVERINRRSYEHLLSLFEEYPEAAFTVNLTGSLLDQWKGNPNSNIISRWQDLVKRGKIEVVGTAKYHPLLSKLPPSEIDAQVRAQEETLKQLFGLGRPRGFFPPEMAYSRPLAESLSRLGYQWLLLDAKANPDLTDPEKIVGQKETATIKGLPLKVAFRQAPLSYRVAFAAIRTLKAFRSSIESLEKEDGYLILAMDAETFGWHRRTQLRLLRLILNANRRHPEQFSLTSISNIFSSYPSGHQVEPLVSSWGNMEVSDTGQRLFPRWDNPNNPVHLLQWQLLNLAIKAASNQPENSPSRQFLAMGEQSDQFWWASGNPCWLPPMVEAGAELLKKAIITSSGATSEQKAQASALKDDIIKTGFQKFGKKPVRC